MSGKVDVSPGKEDISLLPRRFQVMFALFCARQVEDGWKGIPECRVAIEVVERWLDGKATIEECRVATTAAYAAAYAAVYAAHAAVYATHAAAAVYAANAAADAAAYATYDATYDATAAATAAAYAAANAANAAAAYAAAAYAAAAYATDKEKVIEKQWEYYNELLYFDEIAEKSLLGGVYVR